jgi:deoxyribose-phosphate aldolase
MITLQDKDVLKQIISKIDYTAALSPDVTKEGVRKACETAKLYEFASVCVYPTWVAYAHSQMHGSKVGILVTVGFPHGSTNTEAKVAETRKILEDGGTEIDMVINIARMLEGDYDYVEADIHAVVLCAKEFGRGVKVIIETGYLSDAQKIKACELAVKAGAEYVKTCTGFGPGKASIHDIMLMTEVVKDRAKVKASGGVASLEDQWEFIKLGASRVAGRQNIVEQLREIGVSKAL